MDHAAWRRRVSGQCYAAHGQLSLPFWAFHAVVRTVTVHVPTDIRTELCLEEKQNRLEAVARHRFLDRDRRPAYEVEIWPGGPSPIDPAREYRAGLIVPTLAGKSKANPEILKLLGAIHMYVWGDGRRPDFVADLLKAGVKRAWIGYDQNPGHHKDLVGKAFIDAAKHAGYLVGPYDTCNNAQHPQHGEDSVSRWPGTLFPDGCVVDASGKPRTGFANRGCELSSEALEQLGRKPIAARLDRQLTDNPNTYFLDVDAYGELHDDYSQSHPMTQHRDRANRLARLRDIRARGVVLGSEHGAAWAVPVIDFGHGAHWPVDCLSNCGLCAVVAGARRAPAARGRNGEGSATGNGPVRYARRGRLGVRRRFAADCRLAAPLTRSGSRVYCLPAGDTRRRTARAGPAAYGAARSTRLRDHVRLGDCRG